MVMLWSHDSLFLFACKINVALKPYSTQTQQIYNSEGLGLPVECTSSHKYFKLGKFSAAPNKQCSITIHQIRYSVCNNGCFYTPTYFRLVENTIQARGTRWFIWLRHCATSRKVADSIPDVFIGIFHWHIPYGRTLGLGLTQTLAEMSTRNISWG